MHPSMSTKDLTGNCCLLFRRCQSCRQPKKLKSQSTFTLIFVNIKNVNLWMNFKNQLYIHRKEKLQLARLRLMERQRLSAKEVFAAIDQDMPFRCNLCSQTYAEEVKLVEHSCSKYAPLDNGLWKCGICSKTCNRRGQMEEHLTVHQGKFCMS